MTQHPFFDNNPTPPISGLAYIENYITSEEEARLIDLVDQEPWITDLQRRVQHYGYKYDYKKRLIDHLAYLGPLPDWLGALSQRLYTEKIFDEQPDQVIVNEYLPGQGIAPHIDLGSCFAGVICSLSLASRCVMDFTHISLAHSLTLDPRSLLVMSGEARYKWKHGIKPRKSDNKILRARRISLTFRKVLL
jgi:alkylated DNA repair dioxygenase AlkB